MWTKLVLQSVSVEEKLELAKQLWRRSSVEERSQGRQIYLIQWACGLLVHVYKRKLHVVSSKSDTGPPLDSDILCQCWSFLANCLNTIQLKQDGRQWVNFDFSIVKTLSSAVLIADCNDLKLILYQCLDMLLSWKPTPAVLMCYDVMLQLTVNLLASPQFESRAYQFTLKATLEHIGYLQSVHASQRKVYSSICEHLLIPLLSIMFQRDDSCDREETLMNPAGAIVKQLFLKEHLVEYGSLLAQEATAGASSSSSYTGLLFDTLSKLTPPTLLMKSVPYLFTILLTENKSQKGLRCDKEFLFFTKFLQLLGLPVSMVTAGKPKVSSTDSPDSAVFFNEWSEAKRYLSSLSDQYCQISELSETLLLVEEDNSLLECIRECLSIVRQYGLYQIMEEQQLYHLQHITVLLSIQQKSVQNIDKCFECFEELLALNHSIIEPLLPYLWRLIISLPHSHHLKSVDSFSASVVSLFGKLHQLPVLLEHVLIAIKEFVDIQCVPQLRAVFHQRTEQLLSSLIRVLPASVCLLLLQKLVSQYKLVYLPLVALLPWKPGSEKRRKREIVSDGNVINEESLIVALHLIVDVTACLLASIPLDMFISGRYCREMRDIVLELLQDVHCPLMEAAQEKTEGLLLGVSLHLQLAIVMLHYSLTAVSSLTEEWNTSLSLEWSFEVNQPSLVWRSSIISCDITAPIPSYLLRALCIVELRFSKETALPVDDVMKYLLLASTDTSNCCCWNGQILAITECNVNTAIWSLVLDQFPYLYPLITSSWEPIANSLLCALYSKTAVSLLIEDMLRSVAYQEMRLLHESLVKVSLEHVEYLWPRKFSEDIKNSLSVGQQSIALPVLPLCTVDCIGSKKLEKFLFRMSPCLLVMQSIPIMSCDDHMTAPALVGILQWTISSLAAFLTVLKGCDHVINCLIVLARVMDKLIYLKKKQERVRYQLDLTEILNWFKQLLFVLDHKENLEESDRSLLQTALLVAMERILQWSIINEAPPKVILSLVSSSRSSKYIEYWQFIGEHIISNQSSIVLDSASISDSIVPELKKWGQPLSLVRETIKSIGPVSSMEQLQSLLLSFCYREEFCSLLSCKQEIVKHLNSKSIYEENLIRKWVEPWEESMMSSYSSLSLIYCAIKSLLNIATVQEMNEISEHVFTLVTSHNHDNNESMAVVNEERKLLCFCLCWQMILRSNLSHEKKTVVHRWMTKMVTNSIYTVTTATDKLVIFHALQLLQQVTALPQQIGLDNRTVQLSCHGLAAIQESMLVQDFRIFKISQQLLLALVQNHSHVLAKATAPLVSTVLKFIKAAVSCCQQSPEEECNNEIVILLTKLIETLTKYDWFNKYGVHCVAEYIVSSQMAPLKPLVKHLFVSGIMILLGKSLTKDDVLFIKSSVNEEARANLQELIGQYEKFHRFKGKV